MAFLHGVVLVKKLHTIQVKQNNTIKVIFCAFTESKGTEGALTRLTRHTETKKNVHQLRARKFANK